MSTPKRPRQVWQPDQPKKKRAPTPVGALVEPARELFAANAGVALDRETWRLAVGDKIASRAEPGWLKHSVLTVIVASAAWAQELSMLSGELARRLRELGVRVQRVRFLVREGAGYKSPGERRRPGSKRSLPPELEAQLRAVSDPELRASIAEAAGYALGERSPATNTNEPRPARAPRGAGARSDRSGRSGGRGPARS